MNPVVVARRAMPSTMGGMAQSDTHPTPDDTLLARYAAGDAGAFDSLYGRYKDRVWHYAYRSVGFDNAAAADVCQDIWLKVVRHAKRYQPNGLFDRWLFGIAHNTLIDRFRRTDPVASSSTAEPPDLAHFVERFAVTDQLEHALRQLSAAQRSALLLHHVEGYTLDEIAQLENPGPETVKSRMRYGIRSLRQLLGGSHGPQ